ncbi:MAG: Tex family protein [Termitinemataceae bacterium]|nr:MAG: Tex family protein [Termitinemataceae bacterium]
MPLDLEVPFRDDHITLLVLSAILFYNVTMELNQEFIDTLAVNEVALMRKIAAELTVDIGQISALISLLRDGSTVPFIARYRKEATGSLDEVQVRSAEHLWNSGLNMEGRRIEIIRAIFEQGKLSEALYGNIAGASSLSELEDIYAPYKRKKKTRGMIAEERGLAPLAEAMKELDDAAIFEKAKEFVKDVPEKTAEGLDLSVPTVDDALAGAQDIIAEQVAQNTDNRSQIKTFYKADGKIVVKGVGSEDDKKTSVYQMYWDYSELLSQIKPHRILAINRGEREAKLEVDIDLDMEGAAKCLQSNYLTHNAYHIEAIDDALKRLLSPAVVRELRSDAADEADGHGIGVFSSNLKNLLMQQPIKGTRVLGIDPGIRTGTKCACLDETGKYLCYFVFKNDKPEAAKELILRNIKDNHIQLIAVGNGTGSKDVQEIITQLIADKSLEVLYTVVDEDGASVYSASDVAREEFPDLDLTIRGAISIGRRLQDPLAELVKIDPKAIGVGLYQHDVNQKKLSDTLDEVVSSVVNNVGVNLNTASASLLKYVSGINSSLAKKIVKYRDEKGKITNRSELVNVPGMGPKSFEQCAGFLRIPESAEVLDNTWVHPENYEIARTIKETITVTGNINSTVKSELKEKYKIGDTTINDIVEELKKPGRDPREGFPKPVMQKNVVNFEDLAEGMMISGKIKNVVDFGAFVDLGIKETALVHISELSDNFIKDPMDAVKVGDILEFRIISLDTERRRISLSRKSKSTYTADYRDGDAYKATHHTQPASGRSGAATSSGTASSGNNGTKKRLVVVKKDGFKQGGAQPPTRYRPDDDGTMYNPFAEALGKMKGKEKK